MDKRASELNGEYIKKARTTDQLYCGTAPGTTGPVESKLARLGNVKGIVVGAFGEGSEDLHSLIHHLAFSRVREAGPQKGRSGQLRTMEAELALTTSLLRRALSVVGVKAQARLLLGRLETIGPGATAAAGRRNYALNLERIWANERRADLLSRAQGDPEERAIQKGLIIKSDKKTYNFTRGAVRRQEDSSIPKCDNMYFRISIHLCFISTLFFNKRIKTSTYSPTPAQLVRQI